MVVSVTGWPVVKMGVGDAGLGEWSCCFLVTGDGERGGGGEESGDAGMLMLGGGESDVRRRRLAGLKSDGEGSVGSNLARLVAEVLLSDDAVGIVEYDSVAEALELNRYISLAKSFRS